MRRLFFLPLLVATAVGIASTGVSAQETRIRQRQTVVIPQELIVEIQRLAREAFGEDALRDLSRELGHAMQGLTRELGHFNATGFAGVPFVQDRNFKFEQTARETKTLAIGATGTLELKNVVGDIAIKAGGGRDATVEIVRVSKGRTDADAKLGLERVTAEVTTRDNRATVHARYPEERRPDYAVSVAYTVTAPAGTRILAQTITGNVTLSGVKGETSINTTTGSVEVSQAGALTAAHTVTGKIVIRDSQGDALDVGTMNGEVLLTNIKTRRLEISAVTGMITAKDIQANEAEVSCMTCTIEYSGGVVAKGRYEFQAHSGDVRLALAGGFDFEGQSFSGSVEADPALGLKAPEPTRTRTGFGPQMKRLRGTVGGGGAFVEATTFSGSVKVGRKIG